MITVPSDYASAASYEGDGGKRIEVGGYVCEIVGARVDIVGANNVQKFVLAVDVKEGEFAGYYADKFKRDKEKSTNAKWKGTYDTFLLDKDGRTNPFFKGLMGCIEKSNNGFKPVVNGQINEAALKGKLVGLIFGEEEFLDSEGKVRTVVKPRAARSVQTIREGNYEVPEIRKLPGSQSAAPSYKPADTGFTRVDDEELPF